MSAYGAKSDDGATVSLSSTSTGEYFFVSGLYGQTAADTSELWTPNIWILNGNAAPKFRSVEARDMKNCKKNVAGISIE